jgi:hypothetical protein
MLVRKTISTFYYALKNYLRKWILNILFVLYFKPYASYLAKGIFKKMIHRKESCITKIVFENGFQNIIKFYPWIQRIILKTLILFCIMQIKPFMSN